MSSTKFILYSFYLLTTYTITKEENTDDSDDLVGYDEKNETPESETKSIKKSYEKKKRSHGRKRTKKDEKEKDPKSEKSNSKSYHKPTKNESSSSNKELPCYLSSTPIKFSKSILNNELSFSLQAFLVVKKEKCSFIFINLDLCLFNEEKKFKLAYLKSISLGKDFEKNYFKRKNSEKTVNSESTIPYNFSSHKIIAGNFSLTVKFPSFEFDEKKHQLTTTFINSIKAKEKKDIEISPKLGGLKLSAEENLGMTSHKIIFNYLQEDYEAYAYYKEAIAENLIDEKTGELIEQKPSNSHSIDNNNEQREDNYENGDKDTSKESSFIKTENSNKYEESNKKESIKNSKNNNKNKDENNKKKKDEGTNIFGILLPLILLVSGIMVYLFYSRKKDKDSNDSKNILKADKKLDYY